MKNTIVLLVCLIFTVYSAQAQTETKNTESEYIYVLHLVPKFLDTSTWTDKDNKAVGEHFERLKKMHADGTLVLAGKTDNWGEKMFGIVIFYAESLDKAKEIANSDPAVMAGVMTVETFPYKIALMK